MIKDSSRREGYFNRHLDGLPDRKATIEIIVYEEGLGKEFKDTCKWHPFRKENYSEEDMPGEGYLGTAEVIASEDGIRGIGHHAWHQSDSEFVYYKILDND